MKGVSATKNGHGARRIVVVAHRDEEGDFAERGLKRLSTRTDEVP
jgi:hypothetical protein